MIIATTTTATTGYYLLLMRKKGPRCIATKNKLERESEKKNTDTTMGRSIEISCADDAFLDVGPSLRLVLHPPSVPRCRSVGISSHRQPRPALLLYVVLLVALLLGPSGIPHGVVVLCMSLAELGPGQAPGLARVLSPDSHTLLLGSTEYLHMLQPAQVPQSYSSLEQTIC